jgi:hypothetical protein
VWTGSFVLSPGYREAFKREVFLFPRPLDVAFPVLPMSCWKAASRFRSKSASYGCHFRVHLTYTTVLLLSRLSYLSPILQLVAPCSECEKRN